MRVLEGAEVDFYAGGDVGGFERLEMEGHFFMLRGRAFDVFVYV